MKKIVLILLMFSITSCAQGKKDNKSEEIKTSVSQQSFDDVELCKMMKDYFKVFHYPENISALNIFGLILKNETENKIELTSSYYDKDDSEILIYFEVYKNSLKINGREISYNEVNEIHKSWYK